MRAAQGRVVSGTKKRSFLMISFAKAERWFSTDQYTSEKEQGGILNFNLLDYRGQYVGFATFKRHDFSCTVKKFDKHIVSVIKIVKYYVLSLMLWPYSSALRRTDF